MVRMPSLTLEAHNLADTDRLGRALAETLPAGTVVALHGTLGAGKTRLVQAIAAASGIDPEQVVSPTFVLCQQYEGRRTLYHLDAYRLHDEDEFLQLGPEEFFDAGGLTFIEWADKVANCLPPSHVTIEIEVTGPESRRFTIHTEGNELADVTAQLTTRLAETGSR
jgi:tRNA threonylcarbamoyladenosine biosynthesis protein TsaE